MKKAFFLLMVLFFGLASFAQPIVIFGNVEYNDGTPVRNQEILISDTDSSGTFITVITNDNGHYAATLENAGSLNAFIVQTYNIECDEFLSEFVSVNPNQVEYEVNFEFCADSIQNCFIDFYYYTLNDFSTYSFNAFGSDSLFTDWIWEFGEGTTATGEVVEHTFNEPGEYMVTLSATSDDCGTLTVSQLVFVDDSGNDTTNCFARFYHDFDPAAPFTFNFYDESWASEEILSWNWEFGDGTSSNEQNPVHSYVEAGEYFVTLLIETETCSSVFEDIVWVGDSIWYPADCQALFWVEHDWNDYLTVHFEDISWGGYNNPVLAWEWNFGDSTTSSLQNPTHTYAAGGEYSVTLTIYADSCTSTFEQIVFIEDYQWGDCQTFFFPEFMEDLNVQFYNMSVPEPESYFWDFGDNEFSSEANPLHQYTAEGIYFVTLYTQIDRCFSAFQMEIQVGYDNSKLTSEIIRAYAITPENSPLPVAEEIISKTDINIYPNPVVDNLNISVGKEIENVQINIYNVAGQLVFTNSYTENNIEINTENFTQGIYILNISIDGQATSLKFVK